MRGGSAVCVHGRHRASCPRRRPLSPRGPADAPWAAAACRTPRSDSRRRQPALKPPDRIAPLTPIPPQAPCHAPGSVPRPQVPVSQRASARDGPDHGARRPHRGGRAGAGRLQSIVGTGGLPPGAPRHLRRLGGGARRRPEHVPADADRLSRRRGRSHRLGRGRGPGCVGGPGRARQAALHRGARRPAGRLPQGGPGRALDHGHERRHGPERRRGEQRGALRPRGRCAWASRRSASASSSPSRTAPRACTSWRCRWSGSASPTGRSSSRCAWTPCGACGARASWRRRASPAPPSCCWCSGSTSWRAGSSTGRCARCSTRWLARPPGISRRARRKAGPTRSGRWPRA